MTGLGKNDGRKSRRRSVDMSAAPPPPQWAVDREAVRPWAEPDERVSPLLLPLAGQEFQLVERTTRCGRGQLRDFAVMLQVRPEGSDEGWTDIVRVDTAHGFVHVDRYTSSGEHDKDEGCVPKECKDHLDKALGWARYYVWDLDSRLEQWG